MDLHTLVNTRRALPGIAKAVLPGPHYHRRKVIQLRIPIAGHNYSSLAAATRHLARCFAIGTTATSGGQQ